MKMIKSVFELYFPMDLSNQGGDAFETYPPPPPAGIAPDRLVTHPLVPEEFASRLRDAMKVQLPTSGAVMDADGVVHEIIGNHTMCDREWATQRVGATTPKKGWCGWNALGSEDVTCLECIGDA